ncbi:hypothetical protein DPMN_182064 [Dreissena polymorpha]|uniref:Uncharacterized protein n=1 Tax=Dreissena polymorpha TaxID=45954 RepID=A0A9D4DET5_DREPO|nr:hypothetical protein DPMN_182064 [Dreissena polymorpha]
MRFRKKTHRRSSSKGAISTSVTSPAKSPTKDALHDELQLNAVQLRHVDRSKVSSSTFNFLGPATALRELGSPTEQGHRHFGEFDCSVVDSSCDRNLNDVCFGCEGQGQCSDMVCSSKETTPSRESVGDVGSVSCESLHYDTTPSPSSRVVNIVEFQNYKNKNDDQSKLLTNSTSNMTDKLAISEMDSNDNLKSSCVTLSDNDVPIIEVSKGDNSVVDYHVKRNISDVEYSPSSPPSPLRLDSLEEDNFVGQPRNSVQFRRSKVSGKQNFASIVMKPALICINGLF